VFLGKFHHTIDSKGRLSIPVKFREFLNADSSGTVIMTTDLDFCLAVYPLKAWNSVTEKAKMLPTMDPAAKNFLRFFYSRATECLLDKQGRILIPPTLREYAGLDGEAVVAGIENKFEIWNPIKWQQHEALLSENAGKIQQTLASLGM
jgi:MraZ protein